MVGTYVTGLTPELDVRPNQCLLKNCTARSCFCAAASDENVPKFLRLPVFAFFFCEYNRYSPDFNLRITWEQMSRRATRLAGQVKGNKPKEPPLC